MEEKKETKQMSIRLEMPNYERLSALAKEDGRTLHNFVTRIINEYLKTHAS